MFTSATSRTKQAVKRLKRLWGELDYAQRRSFELQTGVPTGARRRARISRSIDDLERLYAA
ncbi:MAG TPA: hypothetical protein VME22_16200 [Solirubrobacteraceae bacterium]|nr:hypothetical protein [Solirubrobacteraceae bacterium]